MLAPRSDCDPISFQGRCLLTLLYFPRDWFDTRHHGVFVYCQCASDLSLRLTNIVPETVPCRPSKLPTFCRVLSGAADQLPFSNPITIFDLDYNLIWGEIL